MAEGGVAAALATTDPRDSWKVHFRDTMRGGKLLNDWRMAKLHAQEAPARVNEREAWGALFDRTPDGRILQRNFGVLKNARGERFMFRYIPEMFRKDFADSEEEADRWVAEVIAGRKAEARRPPELLTRDVVARAITQEVREGRGSPHGGAFLDLAPTRT